MIQHTVENLSRSVDQQSVNLKKNEKTVKVDNHKGYDTYKPSMFLYNSQHIR